MITVRYQRATLLVGAALFALTVIAWVVTIGLLTAETLPVAGVESARKLLDPTLPSNALIERAKTSKPQ